MVFGYDYEPRDSLSARFGLPKVVGENTDVRVG